MSAIGFYNYFSYAYKLCDGILAPRVVASDWDVKYSSKSYY